MTTTLYFIRHAESDATVREEEIRPLTPKGTEDAKKLARFFSALELNEVYASPYQRTVDTVQGVADAHGLTVHLHEGLRERRVGSWVEDFMSYAHQQWGDFRYKLAEGECLEDVQRRNLAALDEILHRHEGRTVVIGTHGTALSTILHHYDPGYGWEGFCRIVNRMPYVIRLRFEGHQLMEMRELEWESGC
ncbi:histidine phosphatase family protein [Gorillibacterium sp. CAU 1737]|uniref:histidine phosphatase family protein n=1 Tax=Gorillibacterium sp. CAU 1737 TaxID=3140362 RepID=UPI0032611810